MALAGLLLSSCMMPPPALRDGGTFADITVAQAQQHELSGQHVRWGGTIIKVTPHENQTCLEIVSRPLDDEARPVATDETFGRFLACSSGFYDPEVYREGRKVTIIGTLESSVVGKIGELSYHYPKVAAETVYLWPKLQPPRYVYQPIDPFWYPYYGPWPYGPWPYGPWRYPW